jgi:hypothetical protein
MDTMSCAQATLTYPVVLFLIGVLAMAFLVRSNENLTVMQTVSAMIGIRRIQRNLRINTLHAATLIIPLALWVFLIQGCNVPPS